MKHMNPKMVKLLHEGFTMKTLEKLNESQLNVLYEKVKKETNEQGPPPKVTSKTVKQIELPTGSKTTVSGNYSVSNEAGKTILTQTSEGEVGESEVTEKSVSKQQQKLMGLALSVKKGDTPKSKVSKTVKDLAKDMSKKDLEDFASTKHKGLPKKKENKETIKKLEENIMKLIENHLPPLTTKGELLKTIKEYKK